MLFSTVSETPDGRWENGDIEKLTREHAYIPELDLCPKNEAQHIRMKLMKIVLQWAIT